MPKKNPLGAALVVAALPVVLFSTLCLGGAAIPPREVALALAGRFFPSVGADPTTMAIVWELRLARSLVAAVAGASLAASGAVLQGLFRNPLADPYSLGVSSGASLGAAIAIFLGISGGFAALGAIKVFSFAGALLCSALVYAIAKGARASGPQAALLLAGAAVSSLGSALVSLIVSLKDRDLHQVFFWLLGGFGGKSWGDLATALPVALASIFLSLSLVRPLDVLGAGEEAAGSIGLDVALARRLAVIAASLGAAAAVSSGGIIGFVGLLGPHIARLFVGPGHRRLIPASAAIGAALLVAADAIARSIAAPIELPVGVITAVIGAPVFLRLLMRPARGGSSL